ncbi:hypothetical protein L6E12_33565 [Actinokineospora sp. PR83]|uniref:hypothetical protein n=1 Tax=Actinokineospora sp. PR83 TaxID=2884908 RepID=UPI001F1A0E74|nr:hypothetical protein [Actinokineospora sp. PR83]MCG8920700.1 hypothetical protein [Actinokineospora sp. PR83]
MFELIHEPTTGEHTRPVLVVDTAPLAPLLTPVVLASTLLAPALHHAEPALRAAATAAGASPAAVEALALLVKVLLDRR